MTKLLRVATVMVTLVWLSNASATVADSLIRSRLEGRSLSVLEGVWRIDGGATLLISASPSGHGVYDITLLDSPDLRVVPGIAAGSARLSGDAGREYTLRLATDVTNDGQPKSYRTFRATLSENVNGIATDMALEPTSRFKVNLWALWRMYISMSVRSKNLSHPQHARRVGPGLLPTADSPATI